MRKNNPFNIQSDKLIERLTEFEQFCMGERSMTPEAYMNINKELSIGTVMCVGRHHTRKQPDGQHLIWIDPNQRTHDLGRMEDLDILHECPGFNKVRTLACTKEEICETEIIAIPHSRHYMTRVKFKDGTQGIGPDFKIAMRNAVLKKELKSQFKKSAGFSLWEMFTGGRA